MVSSCKDQRNAVAICLQKSPCVMIQRNRPKDCVNNPELLKELPEQCRMQLMAFMQCKRGIVDMRTRFRGNGSLSTGRYDEQLHNLSTGAYDIDDEKRFLAGLRSKEKSQ